jgi:hypothetical protein
MCSEERRERKRMPFEGMSADQCFSLIRELSSLTEAMKSLTKIIEKHDQKITLLEDTSEEIRIEQEGWRQRDDTLRGIKAKMEQYVAMEKDVATLMALKPKVDTLTSLTDKGAGAYWAMAPLWNLILAVVVALAVVWAKSKMGP